MNTTEGTTMKLTEILRKLPPGGSYLGTHFASDMDGHARECIVWMWTERGCTRKGYFAIDDGSYIGDFF